MNLPPEFEFSQTNLQDYADCRRRFYLRYLRQVAWPALTVDTPQEFERHLQRGQRFHRLAQQYLLGLPPERLASIVATSGDEDLQSWWANFTRSIPGMLDGERYVEMTLTLPVLSATVTRLVAKYDLVVIVPGQRATIFDWKTTPKVTPRTRLSARLQTRVYPYLFVQAGAHLNGGQPIQPSQVEMVYWFAAVPQQPVRFPYSQTQFEQDGRFLSGLINEVQTLSEVDFTLTEDTAQCRYCVYRSLCERGILAGDLDGLEEEPETGGGLDFDLDQIAEIKF